ncbi:MAG: hypothetical protein J5693_04830 [Bacteroidales bacterium]|nr:hypothetical protein [Bacteroidales bacterium]
MKRMICAIAAIFIAVSTFAQTSLLQQRNSIVEVDYNNETLEVFSTEKDGQLSYYLSAGRVGIGNEVIQVYIDPLTEIFIPLGNTLADAIKTLQDLQTFCKNPSGTTMTMDCCISVGLPNDNLEPVTVTARKILLSRRLEFSVNRDGFLRANFIPRSNLNSMVTSIKIYSKLHPSEK